MLAPLTLLLVFLPLSPLTGIVLFAFVPLIPLAIMKVQKFAKKMLGKYWDAYANLGDSFLENLQGLTTLKLYSADQKRHEEMNKESENFRIVTMKVLSMQLNSVSIMDLVAYGASAIGSILAVIAYNNSNVNFGQSLAMIMLSSEFFLSMRTLGSYFHVAMNGVAASEKIFRLLELRERPDSEEEIVDENIFIRNLSFSYDGKSKVLDNISLEIPKGKLLSIVGESGCGKSTFSSIISGRRINYDGSFKYGFLELKDISQKNLFKNITSVSNNSYLFEKTIYDSLLEAKSNASEEEMIEV